MSSSSSSTPSTTTSDAPSETPTDSNIGGGSSPPSSTLYLYVVVFVAAFFRVPELMDSTRTASAVLFFRIPPHPRPPRNGLDASSRHRFLNAFASRTVRHDILPYVAYRVALSPPALVTRLRPRTHHVSRRCLWCQFMQPHIPRHSLRPPLHLLRNHPAVLPPATPSAPTN